MKIIDIDLTGTQSIIFPDDAIDYESDEFEADILGKNRKILLRIKSKHSGYAHEIVKNLFVKP